MVAPRTAGLTALVPLLLASCEKVEPVEVPAPSPNASILPALLASAPPRVEAWTASSQTPPPRKPLSAVGRAGESADSGAAASERPDGSALSPPVILRADGALDPDTLATRDVPGVSFEGEWRTPDVGGPPKLPEQSQAGLESARKLTALRWTVDLATVGRMRVVFHSRAFAVTDGTELRARSDRVGHVLVWPNATEYRVLSPGTARTLLAERRTDVTPLVAARTAGPWDAPRRFGAPVRRWELGTRTGKLVLDQVRLPSAGEGGPLFCRLLVELIAADPLSAPCNTDETPVRASFTWPQGGAITFDAGGIVDRAAFSSSSMLVPPPLSRFTPLGLPSSGTTLLTAEELSALRIRPIEPAGNTTTLLEGLSAQNGSDLLRLLFVDSVPVLAVAPGRTELAMGLSRGRYQMQWRTFLGEAPLPADLVDVPARVSVGVADGGAPPR